MTPPEQPPDPRPSPATGHGHGPAGPAGRGVRIAVAVLLVPAALATLLAVLALYPFDAPAGSATADPSTRIPAQVTARTVADCAPGSGAGGCVAVTVLIPDGRSIVIPPSGASGTTAFDVGDDVVLLRFGADPDDPASYRIVDVRRAAPLQLLAGLFVLAVVALGRRRGVAALAGLGFTALVLVAFVLPAILAGRDPLTVAVVGSCAIVFGALPLTHGFSVRTSIAVLGTLLSLLLIGLLGAAFATAARLTGIDETTAALSTAVGAEIDGRGLILAGLVIGALGALDDVTVTQTSAVWELHRADPGQRAGAVFGAAMRIGRDHVAAAVNTLVLAYAGAALPLLLLFAVADRGLADTLTTQVIATEVIRALVGSVGLVASVPLTTALAVAVVTASDRPRGRPHATDTEE